MSRKRDCLTIDFESIRRRLAAAPIRQFWPDSRVLVRSIHAGELGNYRHAPVSSHDLKNKVFERYLMIHAYISINARPCMHLHQWGRLPIRSLLKFAMPPHSASATSSFQSGVKSGNGTSNDPLGCGGCHRVKATTFLSLDRSSATHVTKTLGPALIPNVQSSFSHLRVVSFSGVRNLQKS